MGLFRVPLLRLQRRQRNVNADNQLEQPQEQQYHQNGNQAGGNQQNGQRLNEIVQRLLEFFQCGAGRAADAVLDLGK